MTSTAFPKDPSARAKPWVDWTNLALGGFLAASPWLALGGDSAVSWNAVACGTIIATAAVIALARPNSAIEWTNVSLGFWLLIAPWVLGFSANAGATWTSVLVGLGVACFAGIQLSLLRQP